MTDIKRNVVDLMQTREELYDRIGYHAFEGKLDALFASRSNPQTVSNRLPVLTFSQETHLMRRYPENQPLPVSKPKSPLALSGTAAGNTALVPLAARAMIRPTVAMTFLDVATTCEFEEIAHLLVHGKLPNVAGWLATRPS